MSWRSFLVKLSWVTLTDPTCCTSKGNLRDYCRAHSCRCPSWRGTRAHLHAYVRANIAQGQRRKQDVSSRSCSRLQRTRLLRRNPRSPSPAPSRSELRCLTAVGPASPQRQAPKRYPDARHDARSPDDTRARPGGAGGENALAVAATRRIAATEEPPEAERLVSGSRGDRGAVGRGSHV